MKNSLITLFASICTFSFIASPLAAEKNADERFFYIGAEAGIVEPVQRKFKHKHSDTKLTLKKSSMYSAKIGYSFYPQMAFEFSGTYQPTYKLGYKLPEAGIVPSMSGKTKVHSQIYMANLVYDLNDYAGFTPFVIGGVGIARLQIKPTTTSFMGTEFFKVKKSTPNCFAWQAGIGVSRNIAPSFSIDVAAKLQAAHNIKVKYESLDPQTGKFNPGTIKKNIGVWEFGIGFTYKFPTFR
jgi:opacity protein-like surface antigen